MTDQWDRLLCNMRESLAAAKTKAAAGDVFAEYEAETIAASIAETERDAAIERAKTPEQLAADVAAREAKFADVPDDNAADDENEDDENEDDEGGDE